jgi:hypothetical protein
MVVLKSQTNLLQVVNALRSPRRLARRLNRRQQQGHQNPDNGNDHQQLNQGETPMRPDHDSPHSKKKS